MSIFELTNDERNLRSMLLLSETFKLVTDLDAGDFEKICDDVKINDMDKLTQSEIDNLLQTIELENELPNKNKKEKRLKI